MVDRFRRIRTAWDFVPRDHRGALRGLAALLILGGTLAGAVVALLAVLWLAPGTAEAPLPGAPATDTAVEDHKRDLAARGAEDKATAATEAAHSKTARARARAIRRERKVQRAEDDEIVDAVRRAPDALQPRLFREQLDRAWTSLAALDAADRERARKRADGGDAQR